MAAMTSVDDIGRIINHMIVEGQIHGGMAQGIGQALTEQVMYDKGGQLQSGSLMDYGVPRADQMPPMHCAFDESAPCKTNLLGVKGCGELGTIGAAPAVVNAVLDAEIARLVALGIDVRCGQSMDSPEALAELRGAFDAVYLAYGARRQKRLPQLDYSRPWVVDGADYLARASRGAPAALGARVVVIGGGSAALDVARSAASTSSVA